MHMLSFLAWCAGLGSLIYSYIGGEDVVAQYQYFFGLGVAFPGLVSLQQPQHGCFPALAVYVQYMCGKPTRLGLYDLYRPESAV